MSESMERRERRIEKIRENDPGFIAPESGRRKKRGASFWMYVGVAVLIILLLVWISIAEFTGDTDVNMINPGMFM